GQRSSSCCLHLFSRVRTRSSSRTPLSPQCTSCTEDFSRMNTCNAINGGPKTCAVERCPSAIAVRVAEARVAEARVAEARVAEARVAEARVADARVPMHRHGQIL